MSLFFPLTILMLLFLSVPASAELRMIDQGALLRAYGFPDNRISIIQLLRLKVDRHVIVEVGKIEGSDIIDSGLEEITAIRYGNENVQLSAAGRRVVDRELPRGRAGDLKLGAAWLMKLSKDCTSQVCVQRALAFISSRSGIPVAEFRRYFRSEVTRKLVEVARREFPAGTSLPQTIQPLIDYVSSFDGRGNLRVNDQALFRRLYESVRSQFGTGTGAYVGYLNTIESVEGNLRATIDREIGDWSIRNR